MDTRHFKYGKSFKIPYRGCKFDSLAELKFALSIEDDARFLREPVIIGYDPKTLTTTNYLREGICTYTPDFLVREKNGDDIHLIEIKPEAFQTTRLIPKYYAIALDYIERNRLCWHFRIIFENEIILTKPKLEKYNLFRKQLEKFEQIFALHKMDKKYNHENIRRFSSIPDFPGDPLKRNEYAQFVKGK